MKRSPMGIAIVGCGHIARRHARCIDELAETRLVTAFDVDADRAAQLASSHGVPPASSFEELLRNPDVDALLLAVPATAHAEVGLPAVESGKHILIEKPLDVDYGLARSLVAAARHHNVTLSVVSQNRFHDDVLWAKRTLTAGLLGRPILVSVFSLWSRDQTYYDEAPGRGRHNAKEGGVLLNQGVHFIDLMLWLFGSVDSVACHQGLLTHQLAAEDSVTLSVEFTSGALGTFQATTSIYPQQPERIEIRCENGGFVLSGGRAVIWEARDGIELPEPPSRSCVDEPDKLEPFRRQHRDFAGAVINSRAPVVTPDQALEVVKTIHAAYESSDLGVRVMPR